MQLSEVITELRKKFSYASRDRIYTAIHSQHVPEPGRNERGQYDFTSTDLERLDRYFEKPPKRGRPPGIPGR